MINYWIKIVGFFVVFLSNTSWAAYWPTQQGHVAIAACHAQGWAQPAAVAFDDCDAGAEGTNKAYCTSDNHGRRVCKCHPVANTCHQDQDVFYWQQDGKTVQTWCDTSFLGDLDFEVKTADLDGDNDPEWVVANRQSTSVGIGVSHWKITLLSPKNQAQKPIVVPVEDYGVGSLVQVAAQKSCLILQTKWQNGWHHRHSESSYFAGSLLQYPHMQPVYGQKIRRYSFRFEQQRLQSINERNLAQPLMWLLSP